MGSSPGRVSAASIASAAAVVAAFFLLRLPLYVEPGVGLGWNSDASLYGLMAEAMVRMRRPIFLFWGGDYLGTLTSMWGVLGAAFTGSVGPLALRLGVAFSFLVAILLFRDALRRVYGAWPASIAALWLAAGPLFFFRLTYAPVSAEQMFFLGAITFWYAMRRSFESWTQWLVLGVLGGLTWWAHRGALFALLPAVITVVVYDRWWRPARRAAAAVAAFTAGIAIGLLPLFAGRTEIDQRLYTPLTARWSLRSVGEQIAVTWKSDLWSFLGVDAVPHVPWLAGCAALALMAVGLGGLRLSRGHALALGLVATNFGFWFFSMQAYGGAVRYLILSLPIVYTLTARGLVRAAAHRNVVLRWAAIVCTVAAAAMLFTARYADARAVAAGEREQHEHWPGGFDPRPALAAIERGQYRVCYANFWLAYKLEWLGTTPVQFIPYRSVNSTQARSLALAAQPGKKCFVALDGTVRTLTPAEEAAMREDTIDLVNGRPSMRLSASGSRAPLPTR